MLGKREERRLGRAEVGEAARGAGDMRNCRQNNPQGACIQRHFLQKNRLSVQT